jgi:hypothetical protein
VNFTYQNQILFLVSCFASISTHGAGLRIFADTNTYVTVKFDNGVKKTFAMQSSLKPAIINACFAGFKKIMWTFPDGRFYKAPLSIKGHKGWFTFVILGKRLHIQQEGELEYTALTAQIVE